MEDNIESEQTLEDLIDERDHVRIQISILADRANSDATELASLRVKARALDALIGARQRTF
jgi:hypothetical protein